MPIMQLQAYHKPVGSQDRTEVMQTGSLIPGIHCAAIAAQKIRPLLQ